MFTIPFYQYKIRDWERKKQQLLEICSTIDFVNEEFNNRKLINLSADNLYTDYGNDGRYKNDVVQVLKEELIKFSEDSKTKNMLVSNILKNLW